MADIQQHPQPSVTSEKGSQADDDNASHNREMFNTILYPDDMYKGDVYYGDMKYKDQVKFIMAVNGAESQKERAQTWAMFKKNPISPVVWYFKNCVLPGAGLGLEGYVLFSIGNLAPLFSTVWPTCWKTFEVCNETWTQSVTYLEIVGIIVGQILVGFIGDGIGRRWGLIQDAIIMFLGLLLLIGSWGANLNGWVICYSLALLFYGIGVGGEYPMTATAAMENATGSGRVSTKEDRLHRGRKVTMAFLMQGWGQLLNVVVLLILLMIFHHGSGVPPFSESGAQAIFRVSFALPAIGTAWLVYYRWFKMPLASKQLDVHKKKTKVTGYDVQSLKMVFKHFGPRLFATAGSWFANDVFFYGNKLFQSQFIAIITPNSKTTLLTGWEWNLLNCTVALVGYYLASFLIDNKLYGRKKMMQVGFLMDFIMFVVPAFHYKYYNSIHGVHAFQAMYFLSSFFNQFGPNSVTFLVAAEVFPTPVRASAHGFSAAVGKLGALFATVLYNYITIEQRFYVVPWFGLAGMIITWIFLPDTTGLDLKEQERRWAYIRDGRAADYHGIAVHPRHLSLWERVVGKVHRQYNPELDAQSKIADMRLDWETKQSERQTNEDGLADFDEEDDEFSPEIHKHFQKGYASKNLGYHKTPFAALDHEQPKTLDESSNSSNSGGEDLNEKREL